MRARDTELDPTVRWRIGRYVMAQNLVPGSWCIPETNPHTRGREARGHIAHALCCSLLCCTLLSSRWRSHSFARRLAHLQALLLGFSFLWVFVWQLLALCGVFCSTLCALEGRPAKLSTKPFVLRLFLLLLPSFFLANLRRIEDQCAVVILSNLSGGVGVWFWWWSRYCNRERERV
jgi:hypothetical protein